jgi:hypothetical protein
VIVDIVKKKQRADALTGHSLWSGTVGNFS